MEEGEEMMVTETHGSCIMDRCDLDVVEVGSL